MQKKLLDEFAMAALTGWLATFRGNDSPSTELGSFCYDIAEIMMAERVKRMPSDPEYHPDGALKLGETRRTSFTVPAPPSIVNSDLLAVIGSMNGRKVTCSELFRAAYQCDGSMEELREVGAILRHRGYRKVRSGGKDYYQL